MRGSEAMMLDRCDLDTTAGLTHHPRHQVPQITPAAAAGDHAAGSCQLPGRARPAVPGAGDGEPAGVCDRGAAVPGHCAACLSAACSARPGSARARRGPGRPSTACVTASRSRPCSAGTGTARTCRPACRPCLPGSVTSPRPPRTGITPISGLFRYLLLCARDGSVAWDDALWRLSPAGIIRCHSLSPHRRWMMSSRSCHNGTGRGLCVVALFAFSRAWRFISVSACA